MSKRAAKTVKPKIRRADKEKKREVEDMIAQMMGKTIDADVVGPKYDDIIRWLKATAILFGKMSNREVLSDHIIRNFGGAISDMRVFARELISLVNTYKISEKKGRLSPSEIMAINADPTKMQEMLGNTEDRYDKEELAEAYFGIRDSAILDSIFSALSVLKAFEEKYSGETKILASTKNINIEILQNATETTMQLLSPITPLCYRMFILDPHISDITKLEYLQSLVLFSKYSENIREIIISPDINVDRFVDYISMGIEKMRNLPGLSDCGRAFSKILNSMDMFRENYDKYHYNFIKSKNPSTIIDSFISDISENEDLDAMTVSQLHKIMNYFQSQIDKERQNMDPSIVSMFDSISRRMDSAEQNNSE